MIHIRKKEILIAIAAFLLGIGVMSIFPKDNQADKKSLLQAQYKLFDTEEIITSISDHVSVKMEDCMYNPSCDVKKTLDEIDTKYVNARIPYEQEKKQIISQYPSLVSEEDRRLYGVKD